MGVTTGADHTDLRVEAWGCQRVQIIQTSGWRHGGDNRCRSHRPKGGGMGVTTGADHTDLMVEAWG
jgi:hypothetical protein